VRPLRARLPQAEACGAEERAEVAIPPIDVENGGQRHEREAGADDHPAPVVPVEEHGPAHAGEQRSDEDERRRQAVEPTLLQLPVQCVRRRDVQRGEDPGEDHAVPVRHGPVADEERNLERAGREADAEEHRPAPNDSDDRRRGEHDPGDAVPIVEMSSSNRTISGTSVAPTADSGDRLRPNERGGDADGGDRRRDRERAEVETRSYSAAEASKVAPPASPAPTAPYAAYGP
jgi:hypothetical protein